jgi:hypothetical protein
MVSRGFLNWGVVGSAVYLFNARKEGLRATSERPDLGGVQQLKHVAKALLDVAAERRHLIKHWLHQLLHLGVFVDVGLQIGLDFLEGTELRKLLGK